MGVCLTHFHEPNACSKCLLVFLVLADTRSQCIGMPQLHKLDEKTGHCASCVAWHPAWSTNSPPTCMEAKLPQFLPFLLQSVNANLMHDALTGGSVTACFHFINSTPIDWFSKKQSMVETATHSSEFVAVRTCIKQVIDLRTTLQCLGVQVNQKSHMFRDKGQW